MDIQIEYDGEYPNLCGGDLVVIIDDVRFPFPPDCLHSGGVTYIDSNSNTVVTEGPWSLLDAWGEETWPEGFPEEYKGPVLNKINDVIPWGCCGGCI